MIAADFWLLRGLASLLPVQQASSRGKSPRRPQVMAFVPSVPVCLRKTSLISAGASPPRDGPTARPSNDQSQGTQLAKLQELVRYWGTDYDWRKVEARLNALPQFMTTIDGVDIHFIHVRSRHPNALPIIITHGWPGSVIEQLKIIGPLTDPTAHGGRAEDAFDVVIPSMPGYGFSGKPTGTGWDPDRIARAWAELMKRLGYTRYVAQGGDWGSPISSAMARQAAGRIARHPHQLAGDRAARGGGRCSAAGLRRRDSPTQERAVFEALRRERKKGNSGLLHDDDRAAADGRLRRERTRRPASRPGYSCIRASRSGRTATIPKQSPTKDDVLDNITLYWLTNTASFGGAAVLGERRTRQRYCRGGAEDRRHLAPGRHHGISG